VTRIPHTTKNIPPGSRIDLDWGRARGVGEAVVFGGAHALILAPERLEPGSRIRVHDPQLLAASDYSVRWCGDADPQGRFKLALEALPA